MTLGCKERVVQELVQTMGDDGRVAAPLRAEAGRALARLGDPRREVLSPEAMAFCHVPAGPFWMGTREEDVPALKERFGEVELYQYDWETPQHKVTLPDYYIARYPVTNAQFRAFVEAGGYQERRYWREAEAAEIWQNGKVQVYQWRYEENEWQPYQVVSDAPQDFGLPFNLPNHPVVGVSWYEALAYTRWLTERMGEWANSESRSASLRGL